MGAGSHDPEIITLAEIRSLSLEPSRLPSLTHFQFKFFFTYLSPLFEDSDYRYLVYPYEAVNTHLSNEQIFVKLINMNVNGMNGVMRKNLESNYAVCNARLFSFGLNIKF